MYYFIPDADIRTSASLCEKQHGAPTQAWIDGKTNVVAFGRVVPTAAAPDLEQSLR